MFDPATYTTFIIACAAIAVVPGPTVTVIIANSLRYGMKAGLLNVAGTQVGILLMIIVLALGLETIVSNLASVFVWLKIAGAAYLVWLGMSMWCADAGFLKEETKTSRKDNWGYFSQGFLVVWANPKALFFFGAFIPQFVDTSGTTVSQTLVLGTTFMVVATVLDASYAVLAGKTGGWLSERRVQFLQKCSALCLIFGGIWLAMQKTVNTTS